MKGIKEGTKKGEEGGKYERNDFALNFECPFPVKNDAMYPMFFLNLKSCRVAKKKVSLLYGD
jgi:hypothetical protein